MQGTTGEIKVNYILGHIVLTLNFSSDKCMAVTEENALNLRGHMLKCKDITEFHS